MEINYLLYAEKSVMRLAVISVDDFCYGSCDKHQLIT